MLGENQRIAGLDVKDAAAALDELGIDSYLVLDRGRQTGGPGFVVSLYAIGNGNMHSASHFNTKPFLSQGG